MANNNSNWRLESVLSENDMEIIYTPEGSNKLMHAISLEIFGSVEHADKIQQYCKKHLKSLIEQKKLDKKMESFVQDKRWVSDYYTNPELKGFERLNLEVAQHALNANITIYSVNQEQLCLKAVIYSGIEDHQELSLYQHDQKHFHLVKFKNKTPYSLKDKQLKQEILGESNENEIVYYDLEIAEKKEVKDTPSNSIDTDLTDVLYETIQISQTNEQEEPPNSELKEKQEDKKEDVFSVPLPNSNDWANGSQRRQSFQRRHKKSLSDTFNPFQVRVPSEFLDLFKASNDFSSNSQFLSMISSHHASNQQEQSKISFNNNFGAFPTNSSVLNANKSSSNNNGITQSDSPPTHSATDNATNSSGISMNAKALLFSPEDNNQCNFPVSNVQNQPLESSSSSSTNNQQQQQQQQQHLMNPTQIDFFNSHNLPLCHSIPNNFSNPPLNLLTSSFNNMSNLQQQQITNLQQQSIPNLTKSLSFNTSSSQQLQNMSPQQMSPTLQLTNENLRRYMGSLKFFDENKNYGFIVMDDDNRDIFVHYDDLQKAGITKEFLKSSKQGNVIRFSFSCMQYIGKYKQSKKAVELQVMPYNPSLSALRRQQHFSYISATPSQ